MEEILVQNSRAYASRHKLELAERLGFGIHGIIHVARDNLKSGKTALKAHRSLEPYQRERDAYHRLRDANITEILGFQVPQFIRAADDLRIIEMSIVTRPFLLDFAGAWLDALPEFPDETWVEREAEKREQFGPRWPTVRAVLEPCLPSWKSWRSTWSTFPRATSPSRTEPLSRTPKRTPTVLGRVGECRFVPAFVGLISN